MRAEEPRVLSPNKCSGLDVQPRYLAPSPREGGRGAVKLAPLRPHSGGERVALKEAALRRRRRAKVGMGGEARGKGIWEPEGVRLH